MSIADNINSAIADYTQLNTDLTNLLAFANSKTGKSDINVGEAIKSLADGYGSGGGGGSKAEKVGEFSWNVNVSSDTAFDTTTPTTANQAILVATNNKYMLEFDEPIDLDEYGCIFHQFAYWEYKYKTNPPPKPYPLSGMYYATSNHATIKSLNSYPFDDNILMTSRWRKAINNAFPVAQTYYYNTNNVFGGTANVSYGISASYPTIGQAHTSDTIDGTSTTTSDTCRKYFTKVTINQTVINVRASTSIASVDAIKQMDSANININYKFVVTKIKKDDWDWAKQIQHVYKNHPDVIV